MILSLLQLLSITACLELRSLRFENGYIDKKCAPVPMRSIKSSYFNAFLVWFGYGEIKIFIIPTKL